jgi:hypothetical protein
MAARSADLSIAESRYRDIFSHSGAPSIIIDQDFTISMANPRFDEGSQGQKVVLQPLILALYRFAAPKAFLWVGVFPVKQP